MLGESTHILEKLELVPKIMLGYYGKNKLADLSAKIVHFSFVLSKYTEGGNKVAWSKDVLRYHLLRKNYVSKENENR